MKNKSFISLIVAIIITGILIACSSCNDTNTKAADTRDKRFTVSDRQYTSEGTIFSITDTKTDREYIILRDREAVVVLR